MNPEEPKSKGEQGKSRPQSDRTENDNLAKENLRLRKKLSQAYQQSLRESIEALSVSSKLSEQSFSTNRAQFDKYDLISLWVAPLLVALFLGLSFLFGWPGKLFGPADGPTITSSRSQKAAEAAIAESQKALKEAKDALAKAEELQGSRFILRSDGLAEKLINDDQFRAELLSKVERAPLKGFATIDHLSELRQSISKSSDEHAKQIEKIKLVYDALDLSDREKLLGVPILRKDIDHLKETLEKARADDGAKLERLEKAMAAEVARVYDLMKWLVGLIITAICLPALVNGLGVLASWAGIKKAPSDDSKEEAPKTKVEAVAPVAAKPKDPPPKN